MSRPKTALLLLFLTMTLALAMPIDSVDAANYYNWLDNPSFAPLVNAIEDPSFESGDWEQGVVYGNWSVNAGSPLIGSYEYTGVYGLKVGGYNDKAIYNFTTPILGADIESFTFYVQQYEHDLSTYVRIYIYYDDTTYDVSTSDYEIAEYNTWYQFDVVEQVDGAKWVEAIIVTQNSINADTKFDDFAVYIEDDDAQTALTTSSSPWYLSAAVSSNYVGIVDDFGRTDDYSCRFSSYTYDNYKIFQDLDYFDADLIQYISCYAYSSINASEAVLGIQCQIAYTDGSIDEKEEFLTNESPAWEELNFGQQWIDDTKYVQSIRFKLADDSSSQTIWIDDCALYSEEGSGASRFTWTTSPEPQDKIATYCKLYMQTSYTFYGTVYNSTGTANQNGTATITTSLGQTTADIELGLFNFTLTPRTGTSDIFEYVGIVMVLDDPETLTVTIQIQWDAAGSSGGTSGGDSDAETIANYIGILAVLLIPSLALGGGLAMTKSTQALAPMGFLAGLIIGVVIAVLTGFVPSWTLIFVGIGAILLLWKGTN